MSWNDLACLEDPLHNNITSHSMIMDTQRLFITRASTFYIQ